MSNSPSRSRGAFFAPGFCNFASLTPNRGVGGAPRNVRVLRHPLGVPSVRHKTRVNALMTRHARRLARRLASHDAGRSPLGAPPWRFWASGPRFRLLRRPPSYNGGQLPSGSVQRAPRSQVVVPGGRGPGPPEANGYKPPPQDATPRSAFRMSPDDALNERGCESIITASICSQEKYSIRSRRRCHQPSARSRSANLAIGINQFAAACASFPHSSACTRTINLYPPPPGRNTEASPSRTSNQSLPKASRILGLWVTTTILVPAGGTVAASLRSAWARRLFSIGVTTNPPSARSTVEVTSPRPISVAVSTARLNTLLWTWPTGILSLRNASPISLAFARPASLSWRCWATFLGLSGSVSAWSWRVAPCRKTITYPPWRTALIHSACAYAPCSAAGSSQNVAATAAAANRAKCLIMCRLLWSNLPPQRRPGARPERIASVEL